MTKKIYLRLAVFLVIINILFMPSIVATSENQIENVENGEIVTNISNVEIENVEDKENELTDEEKKQIEELNNIIKELVRSIKSKLKTIDEKIEYIRTIEEYEIYPAIRLNVDTPIFGLASVTNSKLKIRQDVSATDIAKGYSVRYIIKNNSIKLPDKYIAGIILTTKDIKFDERISLTDANASVIKLMQYSKTVDNVLEFLNSQTNKIFRGYIDKSKSETIDEIQRNLNNLEKDLLKQDEKLIYLYISLTTAEEKQNYDKLIETFSNVSQKVKENKKKINNILITNEALVKVQKDVLELESKMIDYSIELDKYLEVANKNIDEKQILLALQSELKERREALDLVVENSVTKKVIKSDVDSNNQNTESETTVENDENKENNTNIDIKDEAQTIEEIKVYDVVSKNILEEIDEEIIKVIDEKVKYYVKDATAENNVTDNTNTDLTLTADQSSSKNNEQVDNQNLQNSGANQNTISKDEQKQIVNDLVKLYKSFISKENKFYLDNLNETLENTTAKTSDLSKYTKSDILNEIRYIYLELPAALENYLDSVNLNSYIETRSLSNNFNKELNNLLKIYVKVSKIYDELNVENVKKNA